MKRFLLTLFSLTFLLNAPCQAEDQVPSISFAQPDDDFFIDLDNREWKLWSIWGLDLIPETAPLQVHFFIPNDENYVDFMECIENEESLQEIFGFAQLANMEIPRDMLSEGLTGNCDCSGLSFHDYSIVYLDDNNTISAWTIGDDSREHRIIVHTYYNEGSTYFSFYLDTEATDIYALSDHWVPVLLENSSYLPSLIVAE